MIGKTGTESVRGCLRWQAEKPRLQPRQLGPPGTRFYPFHYTALLRRQKLEGSSPPSHPALYTPSLAFFQSCVPLLLHPDMLI